MNIFLKLFAGVGALSAVGGAITFFNKGYSNEHKNSSSSPNGTSTVAKSVDVKRQPETSLVPSKPAPVKTEKKVEAKKEEGAQNQEGESGSQGTSSRSTTAEGGGESSGSGGKTST